MTPEQRREQARRAVEVDALVDELGDIADQLALTQRRLDDLFTRRMILFRRLDTLGVSKRAMGRASRMSGEAVRLAFLAHPLPLDDDH